MLNKQQAANRASPAGETTRAFFIGETTMIRPDRSRLSLALLVALGILPTLTAAAGNGHKLTASLSGDAEAPTGSGDPDGSGTATVTLNPGQQQLCYELEVSNIADVSAAHIHEAPAGKDGPPVVTLDAAAKGCVSASSEQLDEILKNPAGFYVNLHTGEFPDGAVRGQLD
jgi:hypothetical protein